MGLAACCRWPRTTCAALNPNARLEVFGQELNDETYAICRSDMMIKGQDASHIVSGNSFTEDGHQGRTFDYLLANPPFGVEWKKVEDEVRTEHEKLGFAGRFGAGLPRINDGSFLFLQHMISKMKPVEEGGSRVAIVFNGSPLFTGAAGSGESEIRRWIIENDWLEAVVALPDQLFYNTGISTYFWIVTNRKRPERRGKVQLVDARDYWVKMRKSLGDKRKELSDRADRRGHAPVRRLHRGREGEDIPQRGVRVPADHRRAATPAEVGGDARDGRAAGRDEAVGQADGGRAGGPEGAPRGPGGHHGHREGSIGQEARRGAQGRREAAVGRPGGGRPRGPVITNRKGEPEPDPDLRDNENVPLPEVSVSWVEDVTERLATVEYRTAVEDYMAAEVLPYVPDAWVDHDKTKIGYEIPLTRHFYKYVPPRPLAEIDAEIKALEAEIQELLREVTE